MSMLGVIMENGLVMPGAIPDKRDRRDFRMAGITPPAEVPKEFCLADDYPVSNQGRKPHCTGHAVAGHKAHHEKKAMDGDFSYIASKTLPGSWNGPGQYTRIAAKSACKIGVCEAGKWGDYEDGLPIEALENAEKHRSESYWKVSDAKQALVAYETPLIASIWWYEYMNRPGANGVLRAPNPDEKPTAGHCMALIGWKAIGGKEYWIFKNSFDKWWGDAGFGYFPVKGTYFMDIWLTSDKPESYPVDERYGFERTWQSFLGEQKTAFNPWLVKKIGRLPAPREINALHYGHWDYEAVFKGRAGDAWLYKTKMEAKP